MGTLVDLLENTCGGLNTGRTETANIQQKKKRMRELRITNGNASMQEVLN